MKKYDYHLEEVKRLGKGKIACMVKKGDYVIGYVDVWKKDFEKLGSSALNVDESKYPYNISFKINKVEYMVANVNESMQGGTDKGEEKVEEKAEEKVVEKAEEKVAEVLEDKDEVLETKSGEGKVAEHKEGLRAEAVRAEILRRRGVKLSEDQKSMVERRRRAVSNRIEDILSVRRENARR